MNDKKDYIVDNIAKGEAKLFGRGLSGRYRKAPFLILGYIFLALFFIGLGISLMSFLFVNETGVDSAGILFAIMGLGITMLGIFLIIGIFKKKDNV